MQTLKGKSYSQVLKIKTGVMRELETLAKQFGGKVVRDNGHNQTVTVRLPMEGGVDFWQVDPISTEWFDRPDGMSHSEHKKIRNETMWRIYATKLLPEVAQWDDRFQDLAERAKKINSFMY